MGSALYCFRPRAPRSLVTPTIRRACLVTRQRIMVTSPKMRGSVSRQLVSTRTTAECSRAGDLRRALSICPTDRQPHGVLSAPLSFRRTRRTDRRTTPRPSRLGVTTTLDPRRQSVYAAGGGGEQVAAPCARTHARTLMSQPSSAIDVRSVDASIHNCGVHDTSHRRTHRRASVTTLRRLLPPATV